MTLRDLKNLIEVIPDSKLDVPLLLKLYDPADNTIVCETLPKLEGFILTGDKFAIKGISEFHHFRSINKKFIPKK